jgi:hypothetical protein
MANMSYCRFRNTLQDLLDCDEKLADLEDIDDLDEPEREAAIKLIRLCREISNTYVLSYADAPLRR